MTVSRAMMCEPIAAWIGTSYCWRGIFARSFSVSVRPTRVGLVLVDEHRERVDGVAGQQHVELDAVRRGPQAGQLVVQRRVAAGARLQLVEEVQDDLGQRQVVGELHALGGQVVHAGVLAAALLAELHDRADVLLRREDRRLDVRLADLGDARRVGHVATGLWTSSSSPLVSVTSKPTRRHRGQQLEVVLALQALADDVHVQQPEEAAAEAEAQRVGGLGLPGQRGVVERELLQRVAQVRVVVGVDREQAAEDHRLDLAVAGERLGRAVALRGQRVADAQLA